ncbi:MAG: hypothetical protein ATN35_04325 [Epulopiscium sp. Nele67-Bin004]|nr:MAG: hypothetical protein ATN35_04325 [Epulopiscium sp. Nele67-Bin004]
MLSKKIRVALAVIGSAMGVIAIAPTDVFATTGQVQETTETSDNFEAEDDFLMARSSGTLGAYDSRTITYRIYANEGQVLTLYPSVYPSDITFKVGYYNHQTGRTITETFYEGRTLANFGISTTGYYDIVIENLTNREAKYSCYYNLEWL